MVNFPVFPCEEISEIPMCINNNANSEPGSVLHVLQAVTPIMVTPPLCLGRSRSSLAGSRMNRVSSTRLFAGRLASWLGQPLNQGAHLSGPRAAWHFPHKTTKKTPWLHKVKGIACNDFTPNFVRTITEIKWVSLFLWASQVQGQILISLWHSSV